MAYDIADERHRRRCRRQLRGLAEGYQKSVFELQAQRELLTAALAELARPLEGRDSLLAARVLPFAHAWQLGRGPQSPAGDLIVIC
ncbi:CRISPR-associated endoribonuclease Cas2 [Halomonas sp. THAF5a]|nr:CRISPR-associated endoribonuclease Cas2 [Halomonas sp. THAF5a]